MNINKEPMYTHEMEPINADSYQILSADKDGKQRVVARYGRFNDIYFRYETDDHSIIVESRNNDRFKYLFSKFPWENEDWSVKDDVINFI